MKQITGIHSGSHMQYTWTIDENMNVELGDYAIVENLGSYALVKVVSIISVLEDFAMKAKQVIQVIPRHMLEENLLMPRLDSLIDEEDDDWL